MDVAGFRAEENKRRAPGRSQTAFSALQVQCINRCTTRAVGRWVMSHHSHHATIRILGSSVGRASDCYRNTSPI